MEVDAIHFNLHETVFDAVRLFSAMATQKSLELDCRIRPDVTERLIGDPNRLRQILVNLLGNAVKFTEKGMIGVDVSLDSVSSTNTSIHVVVKDTGIGIPVDIQSRIFSPFDQGEASVTRRYGGTGLGLSISSQLVGLMNGRIWVESKPNEGSEFHFVISLGNDQQEVPASRSLSDHTSRPCLVYCERLDLLKSYEEDLPAFGYNVLGANSLDVAQAVMTLPEFNEKAVLIFDLDLQPQSAIHTIRELITQADVSPSLLIILAPTGIKASIEELRAMGITSILEKPVSYHAIVDALTSLESAEENCEPDDEPHDNALLASKILVVDDSQINLEVARGILEWLGQDVEVASNGVEATKLLEEREFDIVFMDIEMPGMDGLTVMKHYSSMEHSDGRKKAAVYAMTAHVLDSMEEECLAAGMAGFISKPIEISEIYQAISQYQIEAANA